MTAINLNGVQCAYVRELLLEELQEAAAILAEQAAGAAQGSANEDDLDGDNAAATFRNRLAVVADLLNTVGWSAATDTATTVDVKPITPVEREHWQLDISGVPVGFEERDRWLADPASYIAMERLHDAYEALAHALPDGLNETGVLLHGGEPGRRLTGARQRLDDAQRAWAEAFASCDALLRRRARGSN